MSLELHVQMLNYMERKCGPQALDADCNDPATMPVDYTHELTRFAKALKQHSLSFAFYEAKESRQKGDFNKAMLLVSEVVRDHITALRNIQNLFDELSGNKPKQVVFQKFRQFEPLEVGMENAPDVFRILSEFLDPWKSEKSELVTQYLAVEKQVDFEQKRMDVLERFVSKAEDSLESVEQKQKMGDFTRKKETLQLRLGTAIIDLADEIMTKMAVKLDHKEIIKYQLRLLRPLATLILSDIRTKTAKDVEVRK